MARLPQPGGDNGNWGDILNDYLSQAHNPNGSLKDIPQSKVTNLSSDLTTIQNTLNTKADTSALATKLNTADLDTQTAAKIADGTSATAGALMTSYVAFGTDLTTFLAGIPSGALYTYTLLSSAGALVDIYTGKKA